MMLRNPRTYLEAARCLCPQLSVARVVCLPSLSRQTWPQQQQQQQQRHLSQYIPRRAMMYVPGSDEKKLLKIPSLDADCIVMDCEDGVALNRKKDARETIAKMLGELDFGRSEVAVRVNSVSSGMAEDDMKAALTAKRPPSAIMLPKVEEPEDIDWFASKFQKLIGKKIDMDNKLRLVIFIESAIGLINIIDICKQAKNLGQQLPFRLDGIVFGSDDYTADIGATRTEGAEEVLYARQKVIVTAKAFKIQAIDIVHINYKDLDSLRRQCIQGAGMGFTGKQVIHPSQVAVVQECFTPSPARIEWATQLIQAFDEHQHSGKGAFTFRGNMIDMPLLLQAKNIVQLLEGINSKVSK